MYHSRCTEHQRKQEESIMKIMVGEEYKTRMMPIRCLCQMIALHMLCLRISR
jgi:hypothetical protein